MHQPESIWRARPLLLEKNERKLLYIVEIIIRVVPL